MPPYGVPQPGTQQVPGPMVLPPGGDPISRQPRYVPPVDLHAQQPGSVIMPEAAPDWQRVPGGTLPVPRIPVMPRVPTFAPPGDKAAARTTAANGNGIPWWLIAFGLAKYSGAI